MDQGEPAASVGPLRIAMLSIHSSPVGPLGTRDTGGMSVYVRELSRLLGFFGHAVDIFTYSRGPDRALPLYPNVRLIHLPPDSGRRLPKEDLPAHLPAVFEALESFRKAEKTIYDIIHSHYWLSGVVGTMAHARWHCPHVTMFHTLGMVKNMTGSGENEPDRRIAHERWLARAVDRIIAPSLRERENLLRLYHAQPDRISVIPCGVNLELFQPLDRAAARRRLGLAPHERVILSVGRLAPLKGLDRLISAAALLKARLPGLRLLFVGGEGARDSNLRRLRRMARKAGLQNGVTFAGRVEQNDLPPYYSAADVLAVTSHYESFGLVTLESLACGTPVVSTPVGGAESILQQHVNGELVAGYSPEEIANALLRVLQRKARQLLDNGRIRSTVSEYGWPHIAIAVNTVYSALLRRQDLDKLQLQSGCEPRQTRLAPGHLH